MKWTIRLIITLLVIALAAFLISCGPEHTDDRDYDMITINPMNLETYSYANNTNPEMGWITLNNYRIDEGGLYYFEVNGNTITLHSFVIMAEVKYNHRADSPGSVNLPIVDNKVIKANVTDTGTFIIYHTLQ